MKYLLQLFVALFTGFLKDFIQQKLTTRKQRQKPKE